MGRKKLATPADRFIRITAEVREEIDHHRRSPTETISHIVTRIIADSEHMRKTYLDARATALEYEEAIERHLKIQRTLRDEAQILRHQLSLTGIDPDQLLKIKKMEQQQRND